MNPFMEIWLGKEYVLTIWVPIALALNFYVCGVRIPAYTFRVTLGLFEKGKFTPYIGVIANIVFSIVFCKLFGVAGIFLGTSVAQLLSYSWVDPYLIYKYEFKKKLRIYFKKFAFYAIVLFLAYSVTFVVTSLMPWGGIKGFILKGIFTCLSVNGIFFVIFYKSEEFINLKNRFKSILKKREKNEDNN